MEHASAIDEQSIEARVGAKEHVVKAVRSLDIAGGGHAFEPGEVDVGIDIGVGQLIDPGGAMAEEGGAAAGDIGEIMDHRDEVGISAVEMRGALGRGEAAGRGGDDREAGLDQVERSAIEGPADIRADGFDEGVDIVPRGAVALIDDAAHAGVVVLRGREGGESCGERADGADLTGGIVDDDDRMAFTDPL